MTKTKLFALAIAISLSLPVLASNSHQGRIIEAAKCSQKANAGYFTSAKERNLKCKKVRIPDNDVCDASIAGGDVPVRISLDVPGLNEHKGARRGNISFNKGGVIAYNPGSRTGAFKNRKILFSNQSVGDQLEFELKSRAGKYSLNRVAFYLDHSESKGRLNWTEYTCSF